MKANLDKKANSPKHFKTFLLVWARKQNSWTRTGETTQHDASDNISALFEINTPYTSVGIPQQLLIDQARHTSIRFHPMFSLFLFRVN